jgi:hypothetical protein
MTSASVRKGATRVSDIPGNILEALSRGEMQSATLAESVRVFRPDARNPEIWPIRRRKYGT